MNWNKDVKYLSSFIESPKKSHYTTTSLSRRLWIVKLSMFYKWLSVLFINPFTYNVFLTFESCLCVIWIEINKLSVESRVSWVSKNKIGVMKSWNSQGNCESTRVFQWPADFNKNYFNYRLSLLFIISIAGLKIGKTLRDR